MWQSFHRFWWTQKWSNFKQRSTNYSLFLLHYSNGAEILPLLLGVQWCSWGNTGGWICSPFPGLGTQGQGCGQSAGVQTLGHSSFHSSDSLGKRDISSGLSMLLRHKSGKLVFVKQFSLFWSGSAKCCNPIFTNREYREYITSPHVEEGLR